jgi:hypothetical protein
MNDSCKWLANPLEESSSGRAGQTIWPTLHGRKPVRFVTPTKKDSFHDARCNQPDAPSEAATQRTIRMKQLVNAALSCPIVLNALRISAVVGTVLNLINQGEVVLAGHAPSGLHVALNYLVPYLVASHRAASNEVDKGRREGGGLRRPQ